MLVQDYAWLKGAAVGIDVLTSKTCADFSQNDYKPNCVCCFYHRLSSRTVCVSELQQKAETFSSLKPLLTSHSMKKDLIVVVVVMTDPWPGPRVRVRGAAAGRGAPGQDGVTPAGGPAQV